MKRIALIFLVVLALGFLAECAVAFIRGYGLFTIERTRLNDPQYYARQELFWLAKNYISDNGQMPTCRQIAKESVWQLIGEQPVIDFGMCIFVSGYDDWKFIYGRIPLDTSPNNTIISSSMAHFESSSGRYHAYPPYPKFVLDYFGGEKWFVLIDTDKVVCVEEIQSEYPPIPGARYIDGIVMYPEAVLPALKRIYPNLEVPPEHIIRKAEPSPQAQ